MFQLEERLHYHCAGWEQYISRADHWISRLAGKGIWSIMKQPIDFGSPYLQKLAQGKWKFSSPCALIECNFVFNAARTHTTCFLFSPGWHLGIWGMFVRRWKTKTKNRTNYTKQCVWLGRGRGLGGGQIVLGWDCAEESLKYVKCQVKLVFYLWRKWLVLLFYLWLSSKNPIHDSSAGQFGGRKKKNQLYASTHYISSINSISVDNKASFGSQFNEQL